jgi:hypothetical protein
MAAAPRPAETTRSPGPKPLSTAAAAGVFAVIAAWFLYFAHAGLRAPLTEDDLMNLYKYAEKAASNVVLDNVFFWSSAYRPLGSFFYLPLYKLFGVDPLPYRIVCFALLGLNLALLYRFCARLAGSHEIAFLATILAAYHAWFVDLYYNSGTIFDLLCYGLYLSAFLMYTGIRTRGGVPRGRQLWAIAALYALALDAKEMAVTLPLFLLLYEAIFHPAALRYPMAWLRKEGRSVWITAIMTAAYVAGKLSGTDSLIDNSRYVLHISPVRFLKTFHLYLNPLLYQDHRFHDSNTVQLLVAMLVVAALLRSRAMLFAWCWLLLTVLPVSFIPHYAAFFEYLPLAGWVLYAATLLVTIRRAVAGRLPRGPQIATQAALLLGLAAFLAPLHARQSPQALHLFMSVQFPSREIFQGLSELRPSLRRGARVLYVGDPFPKESYTLLFATALFYRDLSITVDRAAAPKPGYDVILGFHEGRFVAIPNP